MYKVTTIYLEKPICPCPLPATYKCIIGMDTYGYPYLATLCKRCNAKLTTPNSEFAIRYSITGTQQVTEETKLKDKPLAKVIPFRVLEGGKKD